MSITLWITRRDEPCEVCRGTLGGGCATGCVEGLQEREFEVEVDGTFVKGSRGGKAHPMDRFAEPDEPDGYEDLIARDVDGREVELTEAEYDKAAEALNERHSS